MKTLKVLAVIAITGLTGVVTLNASGVDSVDNDKGTFMHGKSDKGMRGKKPNHIISIMKKLDLSSEQKSALKNIRKDMKKDIQGHRKSIQEDRDIGKYISIDGFDKVAFIQEAGIQAKNIAKVRADMFEKIVEVLTPEQRIDFMDMLGKLRKNR